MAKNYNAGRGQKCKVSGKDILFMLLIVLKHGGHWDLLGRIFKIKGPTFERMITLYVTFISSVQYKTYVKDLTMTTSMKPLRENRISFTNFPKALYATDVTFQQSFSPSGSI